eukprot:981308-Rhodomonas_salina.1
MQEQESLCAQQSREESREKISVIAPLLKSHEGKARQTAPRSLVQQLDHCPGPTALLDHADPFPGHMAVPTRT